ncbi:MAG: hypothetical protein IPK85_05310 [Gemmatimonadetes bacterium]|nr:hypothetical protein [Gemmatimonadota bacterium]
MHDTWIPSMLCLVALLACHDVAPRHGAGACVAPDVTLASTTESPGTPPDPAALAFSPDVAGELPIGPASFAVLSDGIIVVADPLHHSVAYFEPTGRLVSRRLLGFSADRLVALHATLWARRATDGVVFRVEESGPIADLAARRHFRRDSVTLAGNGDAWWRVDRDSVRLEAPAGTGRLMSVRHLPSGGSDRWVAWEFVSGDSLVTVTTVVSRHTADGAVMGSSTFDHPDVDVPPTDEFAVIGDRVYQLLPLRVGSRLRTRAVVSGA